MVFLYRVPGTFGGLIHPWGGSECLAPNWVHLRVPGTSVCVCVFLDGAILVLSVWHFVKVLFGGQGRLCGASSKEAIRGGVSKNWRLRKVRKT